MGVSVLEIITIPNFSKMSSWAYAIWGLLYIFFLFVDAVSSSHFIALNGMMITNNELESM
jgi:flagellar biosynthesis protein FliP